jgi:hypothetical protein
MWGGVGARWIVLLACYCYAMLLLACLLLLLEVWSIAKLCSTLCSNAGLGKRVYDTSVFISPGIQCSRYPGLGKSRQVKASGLTPSNHGTQENYYTAQIRTPTLTGVFVWGIYFKHKLTSLYISKMYLR